MEGTIRGTLILENGIKFNGNLFGYTEQNNINGDIVFQTGMVGYIKALTDPSYKEQFLVFTYPIMGNYGVPKDDINFYGYSNVFESNNVHPNAIIVQENVEKYSHWNADKSLNKWLNENKVVGISGIDTRQLTKIIREYGTMKAKIVRDDEGNEEDGEEIIDYIGKGLVSKVTKNVVCNYSMYSDNIENNRTILIIDCGMKNSQINILIQKSQELNKRLPDSEKFNIKVVPYNYDIKKEYEEDILGIFISNGPGDPRDECLVDLISGMKKVLDNKEISIFGICLGHQILSLAKGYKIEKMKYGNRGHNIPVRLNGTNYGFITSQNHDYNVLGVENDFNLDLDMNMDENMYFYNLNDKSNDFI
jgi:carbamoyl-phosphate synthase small subunit